MANEIIVIKRPLIDNGQQKNVFEIIIVSEWGK